MKVLKCLIVFSMGLLLFSCANEESSVMQNASENQETILRTTNCTSPEPVTITENTSSITVNTIVDPNVDLISIHDASYGNVETLCDYWTGGDPDCGPNLTSGTLADGDYFLKVSYGTGFCWIPFTIPGVITSTPCDPVTITSENGNITVACIDDLAGVTRLDIHNTNFSQASPSALCNPWGAPNTCVPPFTVSGFAAGDFLLRIESSSGVGFVPITIN